MNDLTSGSLSVPMDAAHLKTMNDTSNDAQEVSTQENQFDFQYNANILFILENGERSGDRTGTGKLTRFGDTSHLIDLRLGYPAVTGKRLAFKTMKIETIDWMLKGKYDLKTLKDLGVRIWDQNVLPGTEVYEGKLLTLDERISLLSEQQAATFQEYVNDLNNLMASISVEDRNFSIETKLNSWGVPERALSDGDLGLIYGKQWRHWEDVRVANVDDHSNLAEMMEHYTSRGFVLIGNFDASYVFRREIDQIHKIEAAIKNEIRFHNGEIDRHSEGRRIILSGWNVAQLDEMSLPPCHTLAQFYVSPIKDEDGKYFLDCSLYQRSNDIFLGCPFNISQYALITEMLAHAHGLRARFLHHTIGDAHIYLNHIDQALEQIKRPVIYKSPKLKITGEFNSILDIKNENVELIGYESYRSIDAPIAK